MTDQVRTLLDGATTVRGLGGTATLVDADGELLVVKRHDHPSAVQAEAAGLRWLGEAAPVAHIRAADDQHLITSYLPAGHATPAAAEQLGRDLAALHQEGAEAFGSPPPGGPREAWIGLAPMRNLPEDTWPEWFAEHRIQPYLRMAVDRGAITDAKPIEQVCATIQELAGPSETPARLHGDLWSGNVLWSPDGAYLIDPAAHGGHRESDLAMLQWFSCPHLDRVLAAYDEATPLADGWRARTRLHQLFPQLVHAALFQGGYGRTAEESARAALRSA
jgi:fructosamine-3-kinase